MTSLKPSAIRSLRQAIIILNIAQNYEELEDAIYFIKKALLTKRKTK